MSDYYQSNLERYLASHQERMMQSLLHEANELSERNSQELYRTYGIISSFRYS